MYKICVHSEREQVEKRLKKDERRTAVTEVLYFLPRDLDCKNTNEISDALSVGKIKYTLISQDSS